MASSVGALSNHYDTLGLLPSATTDEIVQAFASRMRTARVRPDITVARLAQLSVAYETLRDPAKRSSYDASIGLKREPVTTANGFIGAPVIARLNRIAEPAPAPPARQEPVPTSSARPEPRVAAFIAASLREPAERSEAATAPVSLARTQAAPAQMTSEPFPAQSDEKLEIEDGRLSIGRTGATLAAGVIGVAILAFTAALPDKNPDKLPVETAQPEPGLTVPLPPAASTKERIVAATPPATTTVSSAPIRMAAVPGRSARQERSRPAPWVAVNDQNPSAAPSEQAEAAPAAVEVASQQSSDASPAIETPAAAPDSAPVSGAVATLPLANATIARTIERIGYGCGRVLSSTGVEGAGGVFTITCSSGDSYRASPVHGRYHFRRLGRH